MDAMTYVTPFLISDIQKGPNNDSLSNLLWNSNSGVFLIRTSSFRYYCHLVEYPTTVPTFNSCTKCVGRPGRIHDRTPECSPIFFGMDVYMTSQLILALIRKLRVSSMYLAYFLRCYTRCLYNQALPDVRSTGAGIKYSFCMPLLHVPVSLLSTGACA